MQTWTADQVFVDGDADTVAMTLRADGTLVVEGNGAMLDFGQLESPWFRALYTTTAIEVKEGVTGIGANAFYSFRDVTSVTLPDTLTTIGEGAFQNCLVLEEINIPETVDSIGAKAFSGCENIGQMVIPAGVTSILSKTFHGCLEMGYITIPAGVTSIASDAFYMCESLSMVFYGGSEAEWKKISGYNTIRNAEIWYDSSGPDENGVVCSWTADQVFVDGDANTIAATLKADGTLTITGSGAMQDFSGRAPWYERRALTKKLVVENGVVHIGSHSFYGDYYSALTEIMLPQTLRSIGAFAFSGNSRLTEAEIPDGVETIGIYAFSYCGKLASVHLPDALISIGGNAFDCCSKLDNVVLPAGVTAIPGNLFYECAALKNVTIPYGVESIGMNAFYGCHSSLTVTYTGDKWQWNRIRIDSDNGPLGDAEIICTANGEYAEYEAIWFANEVIKRSDDSETVAATLDRDGRLVFTGKGALQDGLTPSGGVMHNFTDRIKVVEIGPEFTSVGYDTFRDCYELTKAVLPDGITTIGDYMFYGCRKLEEVNIPDTVTAIGESAFFQCAALKRVNIPAGVNSIKAQTFYLCAGLTEVEIPVGVTSIGNSAFYGCYGLTEVVIPEGVTSIGQKAFWSCYSLAAVEIPSTVEYIGTCAFRNSLVLRDIYYPGTEEQLKAIRYDAVYEYDGNQVITFGSPITAFPIADHDDPPATIHYQSKLPDTAVVNGEGKTIFKYGFSGLKTVAVRMMADVPEGSVIVLACYDENGRLLQSECVKNAATELLTLHGAAASARLMAVDSAWAALCAATEIPLQSAVHYL